MNKEYISGILKKLEELKLGNTPVITDKMASVWAECLDDLKPELIAAGCKHLQKNGTESGFFPSAPEFRKVCKAFDSAGSDNKLDKAWKLFKNFIPNLQGYAGKQQQKLLDDDPSLMRCIEAFHSDWSNATPESSSYWYKIFSENYQKASVGQLFEQGKKHLETKKQTQLSQITIEDFKNND